MENVVVLGATGMLGSMVTDFLARDDGLKVAATARSLVLAERFSARLPMVRWRILDAASADEKAVLNAVGDSKWIVNAIGVTKTYIRDEDPSQVERAIRINALFPHDLGLATANTRSRILQIATDCVYSGARGRYVENDPHDPLDVYGKTKSLGEASLPNMHHLRCSIVGPEPKTYASLLEWFRRQPPNANVNGYTNHKWNGVTTLHFARLCHGIIKHALSLPHVQHVIPDGVVSKADLLHCFAHEYRREDVHIAPTEAERRVERTLSTMNGPLNQQLWEAAGYAKPPSVAQMVAELARFDYRLEGV